MARGTKERVDDLETALKDFTRSVGLEFNKLNSVMTRSQQQFDEFKDEMKEFKDEMLEFKDEMKEFKDEMQEFKVESKLGRDDMNRKWGHLADKMGTFVEDLIHPSMPEILKKRYGAELDFFAINLRRRRPDGTEREFDAVGIVGGRLFLNSTKSKLHTRHVENFGDEIAAFREFFPEYQDKKIIGMLAALSVPDNLLSFAERKGFLLITIGGTLMECLNSPDFQPREF